MTAKKKRKASAQAAVPDLEAIKQRLLSAGYPRPVPDAPPQIRAPSREAQEARAVLREHIIDDVWALIEALEALNATRSGEG